MFSDSRLLFNPFLSNRLTFSGYVHFHAFGCSADFPSACYLSLLFATSLPCEAADVLCVVYQVFWFIYV
jgi:hypothetical protein